MPKPIHFLLAGLLAAVSQAATLSAPSPIALAGGNVSFSLSLSSDGQQLSGIQFDLAWDPGLDVQVASGVQTGTAAKTLYTSLLQTRMLRCLIVGRNTNVLADGEILQLFVSVGSTVTPGVSQLRVLNLSAVGPAGAPGFLTAGVVPIQVQSGSTTKTIQPGNIINAASFIAGPVSPGEIITLFATFSTSSPTILFNGAPAPILYAGVDQMNAIVPFGLSLGGPAQVQIQQGSSVATVSVPVAAASPAIFTLTESGTGAGAILNQDYSVNSPANPAARGSVIMVYGTGFGALSPLPPDGQIENVPALTPSPVTATIAGIPAAVIYSGAAPGLIAGAVQINVRVPEGVGSNPAAPLLLSMGSFATPPGVTVSIQ